MLAEARKYGAGAWKRMADEYGGDVDAVMTGIFGVGVRNILDDGEGERVV